VSPCTIRLARAQTLHEPENPMAVLTHPDPGATLDTVADETTGQRIKRLRSELGWTQRDLCNESGVSVATLYLLENDREGKRGEREASLEPVMDALERGRQRQVDGGNGGNVDREIVEFLSSAAVVDQRVTRVGPGRKARWISALVVPPGTSEAEIAAALEEMHRRREGD
jgi:transcriptional regulator with XRE-family HTH domain